MASRKGRPRTEGTFKDGNRASITHGTRSLENSGPSRLSPENISRLSELRDMVKSDSGRMDIRRELTARMALICDLGFSHLSQQQQDGANIWDGGIIRRLATYTAETRRLLDSFQELPAGFDAERERIKQVLDHDEFKGIDLKNGNRGKRNGGVAT